MKKTAIVTCIVGGIYLALAVLRLTPISNITGKFMMYIGFAAFLLLLIDIIALIIEDILNKESLMLSKIFEFFRYLVLAGALVTILVLPNLNMKIPVKLVNALSDVFTLAGFGLAILLIGLKQKKMVKGG